MSVLASVEHTSTEIGEGLRPTACALEPAEQPEATTAASRQVESASSDLTRSSYQMYWTAPAKPPSGQPERSTEPIR